ncbi:MAG: rhomboid family intramembrane serine protease [Desulfocapsaceae bacterium]
MKTESQSGTEVTIFASDDMKLVDTCSLVLSAKNIGHRIDRNADGSASITVAVEQEQEAAGQLKAYFRENRNWPPPLVNNPVQPLSTGLPVILTMAALALFYAVTGPYNPESTWFSGGAGNSGAVLQQGQYFRLITALCLHSDFSHLAGNVLIGGFLLHFFLQISGTGVGLLSLLLTAATGNYVNALIHGPGHISIGFSTAVFAMIGLLSAHQIIEHKQVPGVRMLVPLMAGAGLLAMLGSSGVRTDLGAHLFGLIAGLTLGILIGLLPTRRLKMSSFVQTCCLLISIFTVLTCWNMALAT